MKSIAKYIDAFCAECPENKVNAIPDSASLAFLEENLPLIEIPDKQMEKTYYFRAWTYRKHIKKTEDGYIVTEFLPDVPWAGVDNAISCPVAHHIAEGRHFKNKDFLYAYIRHFAMGRGAEKDIYSYSNPFIDEVCRFVLREGNLAFGRELYPHLCRQYEKLKELHGTTSGLYFSNDNRDGMEYSISGPGLRPTFNSYLYADAMSLAALADALGDGEMAEELRAEAGALRSLVHRYLYDAKDGFYKTIPAADKDADPDFDRSDPDHDCREEIGYLPFLYGLAEKGEEGAFRLLFDETCFAAPYGPTTADRSHPRFMKCTVNHECLWDGPSWPYATSQTLSAMEKILHDGTDAVTREEYMSLLSTYSRSHTLTEGGRTIPFIDEDLDPFTGEWIARDRIIEMKKEGIDKIEGRGMYYNHSTFCDLVLSGAFGISVKDDTLTVDPLALGTWKTFSVENLTVRGRTFAVSYDGRTLSLSEGGRVVAAGERKLSYSLL